MSRQPRRSESLDQDLALIGHLEAHLAAISDPTSRLLLSLASTVPITNSDVSHAGGRSRNTTWYQLSKLTRLGMLEKRGHHYRTSPYAVHLVQAAAVTFRAVVSGKMPETELNQDLSENNTTIPPEVLGYAEEGVKVMYERGLLTQDENNRRLKLIQSCRVTSHQM